jgi:hypothetical protein
VLRPVLSPVSVDASGVCPEYVRRLSAGRAKSDKTPDRPPDGLVEKGCGLLARDVMT